MKLFIVLVVCGLVALSSSEPQRYRNSRYRSKFFARQEAEPISPPAEDVASAPYPPSGWKPDGETLELPAPTQPTQEYGPPDNQFEVPEQALGQPDNEYGPPENQYGPPEPLGEQQEEEDETATEPQSETFAPLATEEESGRYRSRYVSRSRVARIQKYTRRAPAKLRKRF